MLRNTAFSAPGTDGFDAGLVDLLLGAVRTRGQLDERVQGDVEPGGFLLVFFHEVGVDAAEDCLVRDDEDVLAAFQLHDDGLEADHDVAVAGER